MSEPPKFLRTWLYNSCTKLADIVRLWVNMYPRKTPKSVFSWYIPVGVN